MLASPFAASDVGLIATLRSELHLESPTANNSLDSHTSKPDFSGARTIQLSDQDIFRFLVSRSRSLVKTKERLEKYIAWATSVLEGETILTPLNIREHPDLNEHIYRKHLPHSNLGHTREGTPIYWEKTGLISSTFHTVKMYLSADDLTTRHVRQQEVMFQERCPKASLFYQKEIYKQVVVFDLAHMSFNIDFTALSVFKRTLHIDEAFYPERLEVLIMINAPWFFTSIWSTIRPLLDPNTANKIIIVGTNYLPRLLERIDISQIPEEFGGHRRNFGWTAPENIETSEDAMRQAVRGEDKNSVGDQTVTAIPVANVIGSTVHTSSAIAEEVYARDAAELTRLSSLKLSEVGVEPTVTTGTPAPIQHVYSTRLSVHQHKHHMHVHGGDFRTTSVALPGAPLPLVTPQAVTTSKDGFITVNPSPRSSSITTINTKLHPAVVNAAILVILCFIVAVAMIIAIALSALI